MPPSWGLPVHPWQLVPAGSLHPRLAGPPKLCSPIRAAHDPRVLRAWHASWGGSPARGPQSHAPHPCPLLPRFLGPAPCRRCQVAEALVSMATGERGNESRCAGAVFPAVSALPCRGRWGGTLPRPGASTPAPSWAAAPCPASAAPWGSPRPHDGDLPGQHGTPLPLASPGSRFWCPSRCPPPGVKQPCCISPCTGGGRLQREQLASVPPCPCHLSALVDSLGGSIAIHLFPPSIPAPGEEEG